ncbi:aldose epimerase family protein [Galbibacter sp.]|uniref:aldose epimerase family protein n=1 Tax=Galbibacter sp. TaxID=2918471 RepID=UPI002C8D08EF|nr:aldose epimerase family protein [Galbibacter sp.]HLV63630.1 aldose epimerase family protein [Galbibacter sp.]
MKIQTISNKHLKLTTIDYGATIQQLIFKDHLGNDVNVVLGYKNLDSYIHNAPYLGASVGRYAGRISPNGITINQKNYPLYTQNEVHLHGGKEGFSFKTWKLVEISHGENPHITYSYFSKDMEEGYPGNLEVFCTYTLMDNTLEITYKAKTDQDTVVNLTNHNYYNLNGHGTITDHELRLYSNQVLDKGQTALPTGKFISVEGTHFDFRTPTLLQKQLAIAGIDDTYVVTQNNPLAELYSPKTHIQMKVRSNQVAVVVYTPPTLDEKLLLNKPISSYPAICFETQNLPDAPNHPEFPSALLKSGEVYTNKSKFEFSIK